MPRYFFDLVDDKKVFDKKGVTLPNEKAAREHAITFARELMETKPELLGESWTKWSAPCPRPSCSAGSTPSDNRRGRPSADDTNELLNQDDGEAD